LASKIKAIIIEQMQVNDLTFVVETQMLCIANNCI